MKSFKQFIIENNTPVKFSSTQVNLPKHLADKVINWGRKNINPEHIDPEEGLKHEIHCTALYGLHTSEPDKVQKVVKGFGTVKGKLGKTSMFETPKYDVLKLDVDSPDMHKLNSHLKNHLPYSSDHPEYVPHVTIGYLKKGMGKYYIGDKFVNGEKFKSNKMKFSTKEKVKHEMDLI